MGCGAVIGGLVVAARGRSGVVPLVAAACGFAVALLVAAVVGPFSAELVALGFVGVASTAFLATGNTTLQLICDPSFRGRVMALWSVTFMGSTPLGGPLIGVTAEHLGPRAGLAVGGGACLVAAVLGMVVLPRIPRTQRWIADRAAPPHPADALVPDRDAPA